MIDFTKLCIKWNIVDKKNLQISDIDRLFYAVNYEDTKVDGGADLDENPDNQLCRYEYFEIIARIA